MVWFIICGYIEKIDQVTAHRSMPLILLLTT